MTERKFYLGSYGPYLYDDTDLIDDPDGDFAGIAQDGFVTDGDVRGADAYFDNIDATGRIEFTESADPGAPAEGKVRLFAIDEQLVAIDENDQWSDLTAGADGQGSFLLNTLTVTDEGGLNISWSAGEVHDAHISGSSQRVDIPAEAGPITLTAHSTNWLFFDKSAGDLDVTDDETTIDWDSGDFPVATIATNEDDIFYIDHFPVGYKTIKAIQHALFSALPNIVTSGTTISEHAGGDAFDVDLAEGGFVHLGYDVHTYSTVESTSVPIIRWFHDASDEWATDTDSEIDAANWDDADDSSGIVANNAAKYYRSMFLFDGTNIHWVYPQEEFNNVGDAIAGDNPVRPPALDNFPACTVLVLKGDAAALPAGSSTQWIDVRPLLGTGAGGGGGVSDHGGLTGLADDDHEQYPLLAGRDGNDAVTDLEFSYLAGLDDNIQDQIDGLAGGHDAVTLDVNANTVLSLTDQEIGLDTQGANEVFAGPNAGADAVPAFRLLVSADIPDLSGTYQPLDAILTELSGLANGSGVLTNDGAGNLSWGAGGSGGGDDFLVVQVFS